MAGRPTYAELEALVIELRALVDAQQAQITELNARLEGDSRNSSRPPSSDGYAKPPADASKRSLRERSGRSPGGQEGAPGAHLARREVPDQRVEHPPERCDICDGDLADAEALDGGESRQVFDLPEGTLLGVVEHVLARRRCGCGHVTAGRFPDGIGAPTQYGPKLRALGVYLGVFQHLPYDRAAQLLGDLAGAAVSTGTLAAWVAAAAEGLGDFDDRLRELLSCAPVAHFDETGARIAGRLGWVHSASTDQLTLYTAHAGRGGEAIDAAGVLGAFDGVAVHDGWAPYRNYGCDHALCNAHHLRELVAAAEAGHTWPLAMSALLCDTNDLVDAARAAGAERLAADALANLADCYQTVIAMGHEEHPSAEGKRTKAHNLLLRLQRDQTDVLRFAHDFRVPFTNNQAEQDIRMVKLQQKISGCWRTPEGADRFLQIRSYTSTARKHGLGALDALGRLAAGAPWLPAAAPT